MVMDNLAQVEPQESNYQGKGQGSEKKTAFLNLVDAGHSIKSAEKLVGYAPTYGYKILKEVKNTSYINPARTKKVLSTFDSLLKDGKDATRAVLVKDYMARQSPITTVSLHLKADITPTDLSPFLNSPNKPVQATIEVNPASDCLDIEKIAPQPLNEASEGNVNE